MPRKKWSEIKAKLPREVLEAARRQTEAMITEIERNSRIRNPGGSRSRRGSGRMTPEE